MMSTDAACPLCGEQLERAAAFCGSCGQRVARPAAGETASPIAPPVAPVYAASSDPWGSGMRQGTDGVPLGVAWDPIGAAPAEEPRVTVPGPGSVLPVTPDHPEPVREEPPAAAAIDTGWSLGLDVEAQVAPIGRRILALLVDQVLACLLVGGTVLLVPHDQGSSAVLIIPGLVALLLAAGQWIAESFTGATAGSALLGIRTVSARNARPAGLWAVLVRSVIQGFGGIVGGIGLYVVACSGAWDEGPGRRGWHDKVAGTLVLRAAYLRGSQDGAPVGDCPPVLFPPAHVGAPRSGAAGTPSIFPPVSGTGSAAHADPPVLDPVIPADTIPTVPAEQSCTAPEDLGDLGLTRLAGSAVTTGLRLEFDTGERVEVAGPGLVGRSPSVGAHEVPPVHLITVADPAQSVSRVHLEFRPVPGGLVVMDRGSTNGTVLVDPAGYRWALPGGQEARVSVGWSVVLGERTMVVVQA